jgi:hypothetical protein
MKELSSSFSQELTEKKSIRSTACRLRLKD